MAPRLGRSPMHDKMLKLPNIKDDDTFVQAVKTLSIFFVDEITLPSTFEQLRTTSAGNQIRILVEHLVAEVTNPAIVNALLTLKWHFSTLEADDRGLNETRANACEIVAWRFLARISERDAVDFCLYELPAPLAPRDRSDTSQTSQELSGSEQSRLLPQFRANTPPSTPPRPRTSRKVLLRSISHMAMGGLFSSDDEEEEDPTSSFTGLNGLEIAAVADCKKFLSQRIVQKIVTGIWNGDITFWESLSEHTQKKPQFYNKRTSDVYTRLRVPRYIKTFEVLFFASFLFLYYAVLVERNPYHITSLEIVLYIWFAAFTYDELGEFMDAGSIFYAVDIWNSCDLIIIIIGAAFLFTRILGLIKDSDKVIDISFDILSLEALFMVPRICSLLSLHPYFGTLIPCLKKMAKDFVKFMVIVFILYAGFLTTFTLLARESFTLSQMSWILIKVFFGSSYLGFDVMDQISPQLGPPLMIIFVIMTNILLITSLISVLSDSFAKVIAHAREEYLYVYSVYVLEASTSNRLTHFYPPLNLIPLIFIRPLRLFMPSDKLRRTRIILLRATHAPIVAAIYVFERVHSSLNNSPRFSNLPIHHTSIAGPQNQTSPSQTRRVRPFLSSRSVKISSDEYGAFLDGEGLDPKLDVSARGAKGEAGDRGSVFVESSSDREGRLEEKVDKLSRKIEELTALILADKGLNEDEED